MIFCNYKKLFVWKYSCFLFAKNYSCWKYSCFPFIFKVFVLLYSWFTRISKNTCTFEKHEYFFTKPIKKLRSLYLPIPLVSIKQIWDLAHPWIEQRTDEAPVQNRVIIRERIILSTVYFMINNPQKWDMTSISNFRIKIIYQIFDF